MVLSTKTEDLSPPSAPHPLHVLFLLLMVTVQAYQRYTDDRNTSREKYYIYKMVKRRYTVEVPGNFLNHDGILTGCRLKEIQYHRSWGYLYVSIESARPAHPKHQASSYVYAC